jgi:hypothetical protein
MKFYTHSFTSNYNQQLIDNSAQVYTDSIISDTLNWILIKGSFIADSAYSFLMIGNFFSNNISHVCTDTIPNIATYTFIDHVCVSLDSLTCFPNALGIESLPSPSLLSLSPNPVQNLLTINFLSPSPASGETIAVYDVAGRKIVLPITFTNNKAELTTTTLPNGIYLLQIINAQTGMSEVGERVIFYVTFFSKRK